MVPLPRIFSDRHRVPPVVEACCHLGVIGSERLFQDIQGSLIEGLRAVVAGAVVQIGGALIEEADSLAKLEVFLVDETGACEGMVDEPFAGGPV